MNIEDELDKAMADLAEGARHAIMVLEVWAHAWKDCLPQGEHSVVVEHANEAAALLRKPIDRVRELSGKGPLPKYGES